MEWNEVPEGIGGRVGISVWHDIVDEKEEAVGAQLPANAQGEVAPGITTFWATKEDPVGQMTEFSQKVKCISIAQSASRLTTPLLRISLPP